MSTPKHHHKTLSNTGPDNTGPRRPPPGALAQEAVGLPMPDSLADARGIAPRMTSRTPATYQGTDACGTAPRKNPRSTVPGVEADACGTVPRMTPRSTVPGVEADARGTAPRKTPRSALPGVVADACGTAPRKTSRSVGRGRRPRGRRPNRRRSQNYVRPSLPRLSPDSPGIDGEIALLRSLTNRLLSTRPLDYTQVNRCLRLIIRAYSARAKAPKQLTDQEQIDNLIKKVFHDTVNEGKLSFFDLLPVRKAKPGDKWWPWRDLIPLRTRREYGLIDPDDPWPHEDEEYFATMDALDEDLISRLDLEDLFEDDEDDDDDPNDDEYPPHDDDDPSPVGVPLVGTLTATHIDTLPSPAGVPLVGTLDTARADTDPSPDWADPNPPPRIARGRPPP